MPKKIILLSDGTGNSAGKFCNTNVWRFYQALDLASITGTTPPDGKQIAYYDDGVGTSSFKPMAILGGAFGWGLKRNVIDLYTFLCRNYEKDDSIYCFGFSRGAFTIRILTGLINSQGLVQADSNSEAKLRELTESAFNAFRLECASKKRRIIHRAWKAAHRLRRDHGYRSEQKIKPPLIAFLGLWDTVAAYGLPIDELTRFWDFFFPLSAPDRNMLSNVERACHALALDDERNTFHPVLWNEKGVNRDDNDPVRKSDEYNTDAKYIKDERLSQVWFTGMHSNVGGGYGDDALAYVSLDWIMTEAERAEKPTGGLRFKPIERALIKERACNVYGKCEDSRRGVGGVYRYLPRKPEILNRDISVKDNQVIIERPKIHESVLDRIESGTDGYAPVVLPKEYAVVTYQGDIVNQPKAGEPTPPCLIEHASQAEHRWHTQEKAWNYIWYKRILYFASVFVASLLVLFPLPFLWPPTLACEDSFCALSPMIKGIDAFLPGFFNLWTKAYQSHPFPFIFLVALLAGLIYGGSWLRTRVFDQMRIGWAHFRKNPGRQMDEPIASKPNDWIYRFRNHPWYQSFHRCMKRYVLPSVAGVAVILLLLAFLIKGAFEMMNSAGLVCPSDERRDGVFPSNSVCWSTGVKVERGQRYQITLTPDGKESWADGRIESEMGGFGKEKATYAMNISVPFRRHLWEPWFKPIARIGDQGGDEYPLNRLNLSSVGGNPNEFVAQITAQRNGELFLFVNDAVLPLPRAWQWFYQNNRGSAKVRIQHVAETP